MANRLISIGYGTNDDLVQTYTISGNTYTPAANISVNIRRVNRVRWSGDGNLLAVAQGSGSGQEVTIGEFASNTFTNHTFTQVSSTTHALAWSSDSSRLAIGHGDLDVFYRGTGNTYTKTTLSSLDGWNDVVWNADNSSLAAAFEVSPYLHAYNRSGNVYTKLTDPAALPTGPGYGVSISSTGNIAVAHDFTPYVTIYSRSGDTLTKIANPANLPTGNSLCVAYSPDGGILAVGHENTPYITLYHVSGTTYTKLSNPATLPTEVVQDLSWDYKSQRLYLATPNEKVIEYLRSGNTFTAQTTISGLRAGNPRTVSVFGSGVTQSGEASLSAETSINGTLTGTFNAQAALNLASSFLASPLTGTSRYVDVNYVEQDYFVEFSDFDYVEFDYVEFGYFGQPFINANAAMTVSASIQATLTELESAESALTSTVTLVGAGDRIRFANSNLSTAATLSSTVVRIKSAAVSLSAFNTVLTVGDRSRSAAAVLASAFTQSALANYTAGPTVGLTTTATVSVSMSVTRPASVSLSAFNTVLTAGARIRSLGSDMTVTANLSASAGKIRNAATNNNLLTINPTPYTGVYVDRTDHFALLDDIETRSQNQKFIDDMTVSFWARCDDYTGGTIFSTPGPAFNFENAFTLALSPTSISLGYNITAGTAESFSISSSPGVLPMEWHHYFIQVNHTTGDPGTYTGNIFVDGEQILAATGTYNPTFDEFTFAENPIAIGSTRNYSSGNITLTNRFNGVVNQLWITNNVNDTVAEFYDSSSPITGFVDFSNSGRKSDNSLSAPIWYEKFDYPFSANVTGQALVSGNSPTTETVDLDYLPDPGNQPILARFTTVFIGDRTVFAEFSANTLASLTSTGSYNKPGSANLAVVSAFTAASYDFTKATVTLSSAVTLTAIADRIKYAEVNINSALSATLTAVDKNTGSAALVSAFTISADPTTNVLGIVSAQLTTSLSALAYDFTKAQTTISANFTLVAEGRYEERIRANAAIASSFTTSVTGRVTRHAVSSLNSLASVVIADGRALRRGNVAMSAFNTVLTAGKLIEFYLENTIQVAQELRVLHVADDVESNVLLVQDDRELNKIYTNDGLETTLIHPEQETGVLLAQHRQPTF